MCLANAGTLGGVTPAQGLGADLIDPTRCAQPLPSLDLGPCDATVGDLELCSAALSIAVAQHLKLITCDTLLDSKVLDSVAGDVDFSMVPDSRCLSGADVPQRARRQATAVAAREISARVRRAPLRVTVSRCSKRCVRSRRRPQCCRRLAE